MRKIFITIVFVLGLIILIASPFFLSKPGKAVDFVLQAFSLPSLISEISQLRIKNSELQGKLFSIQNDYSLPQESEYLRAKIFSLYPFNTKNRIYITLGEEDGIRIGDVALFSKTSLIGQVSNVSKTKSEVVTIFDNNYSVPVKIGKNQVDGLLQGGVNPEIGLIDKTKGVTSGDEIIVASRDLPFGLLVGSVKSLKEDSSGSFLKANIQLPYALSDILTVYILRND